MTDLRLAPDPDPEQDDLWAFAVALQQAHALNPEATVLVDRLGVLDPPEEKTA